MELAKTITINFGKFGLRATVDGEPGITSEGLSELGRDIVEAAPDADLPRLLALVTRYHLGASALLCFGVPGERLGDAVEIVGDQAHVLSFVAKTLVKRARAALRGESEQADRLLRTADLVLQLALQSTVYPAEGSELERSRSRAEWQKINPGYDLPSRITRALGQKVRERKSEDAVKAARARHRATEEIQVKGWEYHLRQGPNATAAASAKEFARAINYNEPRPLISEKTLREYINKRIRETGSGSPPKRGRPRKSAAKKGPVRAEA